MIRISELRLPLEVTPSELAEHPDLGIRPAYLEPVFCELLQIEMTAVDHWRVFKRSFDARKSQIYVVYIVDIALKDTNKERPLIAFLKNFKKAEEFSAVRIQETPDMRWHAPLPISESASSNPEGLQSNEQSLCAMPTDLEFTKRAQAGLRPVVVGFGPCGIFAALALAQMGLRPIVLERGKKVRERTKDTWGLWRKSVLNEDSNVQFGEGGAGTFSDGKLYSQIKDPRFLGRKVIEEFVKAGAPEDILYAAHPHIGTFKLVKVVENLRAQIEALGGEVHFQQHVVDLVVNENSASMGIKHVKGLIVRDLQTGQTREVQTNHVIMALGHSARDSFLMLYNQGVCMHSKPFSVGFRVEHPQGLIDRARWGRHAGNPLLGAADYKLVHHASNGRAVYSFCMCPGGTVVAATSEAGRVVTNGMSQYSRNERNANAALVVGIEPSDYPTSPELFEKNLGSQYKVYKSPISSSSGYLSSNNGEVHPLAGIVLQRELESKAFVMGGSDYKAPAQRIEDYVLGRASLSLGSVIPSYKPGVLMTDLAEALPSYATFALREALPEFGRQIKGFDLPDAVLTGIETRTSSPLRIDRDESFQNSAVRGLYPAGEGAGYAGGILSAGVDGIKVAEGLARIMNEFNVQ